MSQGETAALDLDIDDGTTPDADAAQTEDTEATEEAAQIDGDDAGDTDTAQVSEADDATEDSTEAQASDETAEDEQPETTATKAKPEAQTPEPKTEDDYDKAVKGFTEEFGPEAGAHFAMLAKRTQQMEAALTQLANERHRAATNSEQQMVAQRAKAAGIPDSLHKSVYSDAVDYLNFKTKQGAKITGEDALRWAIRAHGGTEQPAQTPKRQKAEKLQNLRSVPPRSRAGGGQFVDPDDPAVMDGTAPSSRRSS
jgi:hypothetical protein